MYVMVDVEANGPIPGDYSMFWFGAVIVEPSLRRTFEGKLHPLPDAGVEGNISENMGHKLASVTYHETMSWPAPKDTMQDFAKWLDMQKAELKDDRLMLVSDNNGYDAMWIAWYFHHFLGANPFGHSSTNLGSLYKGMVKDTFRNFKHLRKTKHTHNPVADAMGNAEALLHMHDMGLRIKL